MSLQKTIMAPAFTCLNHPLSLESLPLPQKPWVLHTEFNRETGTRPTLTHTIYLTFHLNVGFSTNTRLNTFFKSELHRKQEAAQRNRRILIEQFFPKELLKWVFSSCYRLYHKAIVNFVQIHRHSHWTMIKTFIEFPGNYFSEWLLSQNPEIPLHFTLSTNQFLILMIWKTPGLCTKIVLAIRSNDLRKAVALFEFVLVQLEYWFLLFFLNVWGRYTKHLHKRWKTGNQIYCAV